MELVRNVRARRAEAAAGADIAAALTNESAGARLCACARAREPAKDILLCDFLSSMDKNKRGRLRPIVGFVIVSPAIFHRADKRARELF